MTTQSIRQITGVTMAAGWDWHCCPAAHRSLPS